MERRREVRSFLIKKQNKKNTSVTMVTYMYHLSPTIRHLHWRNSLYVYICQYGLPVWATSPAVLPSFCVPVCGISEKHCWREPEGRTTISQYRRLARGGGEKVKNIGWGSIVVIGAALIAECHMIVECSAAGSIRFCGRTGTPNRVPRSTLIITTQT